MVRKPYCNYSLKMRATKEILLDLHFAHFPGCYLQVTRSHNNCFQLPRVFVNGKFVGGASDLEFLEITGELQDLLKQAKCYKPVKPF